MSLDLNKFEITNLLLLVCHAMYHYLVRHHCYRVDLQKHIRVYLGRRGRSTWDSGIGDLVSQATQSLWWMIDILCSDLSGRYLWVQIFHDLPFKPWTSIPFQGSIGFNVGLLLSYPESPSDLFITQVVVAFISQWYASLHFRRIPSPTCRISFFTLRIHDCMLTQPFILSSYHHQLYSGIQEIQVDPFDPYSMYCSGAFWYEDSGLFTTTW